jgi:hypothetical protein
MAKNTYIQIKRKNEFEKIHFEIDFKDLAIAAGELKHCGLRVYLYLVKNADLFTQQMSPENYASWFNMDYAKSGRNIRKQIDEGIEDLLMHGYLRQAQDSNRYEFSEQKVPEWIELAKNAPKNLEQKVPEIVKVEQKVPNKSDDILKMLGL